MEQHEKKVRVLIVTPDRKKADEIAVCLTQSGFEITGEIAYLFNVMGAVEQNRPDIIIYEGNLGNDEAHFIASFVKVPVLLISDQKKPEIKTHGDKVRIIGHLSPPASLYQIVLQIVNAGI